MRPKFTKSMVGFFLIVLLGISTQAQDNEEQVSVKITRDVDGGPKTFEKTYASEEEMKNDEDLKAFMGDDVKMNLWFGDVKKEGEWNDKNSHGFFFNFDDKPEESFSKSFHFFEQGDSAMKELDFNINSLDEHLQNLDLKIREHLKDLDGGPMIFDFGDGEEKFVWHFDESLADQISMSVEKILEGEGNGDHLVEVIVVKKLRISEDVDDFGKKGKVKSSDKLQLNDLKYYPNPAPNGRFKLNFGVPEPGELAIKIYNLDGKEIYNRYFETFSGLYAETIDLSGQSEGIYLLEIQLGGKRLTRKIAID